MTTVSYQINSSRRVSAAATAGEIPQHLEPRAVLVEFEHRAGVVGPSFDGGAIERVIASLH